MANGGWVATHEDVTEKVRSAKMNEQQKLQLAVALENMSQGLCLFDGKQSLIVCNKQYAELYGLNDEQTKPGKTVREILQHRIARGTVPDDHENYIDDRMRRIEANKPYQFTSRLTDGRYVSVISRPLEGGGWVATHEDVTEVKHHEESFQLLFTANPVPMWVIDWDSLHFIAINDAAVTHYGYSREQFMSMTVLDLRPVEDRRHFEQSLRAESADDLVSNSLRHSKADGSIIDVCVYSRALVYAGHKARLVAIHDITKTKQVEDELRRTQNFLNTIVENVPLPIIVKSVPSATEETSAYRFTLINKAAENFFGVSRDQVIGKSTHDVHPKEHADFVVGRDSEALAAGILVDEHSVKRSENDNRIVSSRKVAIRDDDGKPQFLLTLLEDITERKQADEQLRRSQDFINAVIENVPLPITVKDVHDFRYILVNRSCEEWFGVSRDKLIGKRACDLLPKEEADAMNALDNAAIQSMQPLYTDAYSLHASHNNARLVTSKKVAIRNSDGNPLHLLTVLDDVTERKRAEQRISHLAHYDTLTDLPNRATFNNTMDATLNHAEASGEQFAVLSIDLDRFKEANDSYGHLVGDALLREVARRLQTASEGAVVARIGGDEFAVILADGEQPPVAAALAERLLATVEKDFEVEGQRLKLGMSIGVAIYPTNGTDAKMLMTNADAALYRAKAEFRGSALFYDPEMGVRLRERHALQEDLRSAIVHDELLLHYQPQMKMSGETVGFEALARWQCPKRGTVSPGTFIPIAEESGLIIPLSGWILREACREAASWPQPLTIAVNISPLQFRQGDLPRLVHSILLETGLAPGRLELEITESVMINDFSRAVSILNRLKSLGVRIAMDDFGTGYSSLSYLQSFSCDKIKIDRIFISDLESNYNSRAIVRAVIGLGQSLNLPIIAEGVETEAQHAYLVQEGCDEVQGYLTGRPHPIADYAKLVGRQTLAQQHYAVVD